jgi:phosphatidylinositol alpha-1,6-mannosyltransferase
MIRPGFWAYKAMDRWMVQAAEALLTNSPYAAGLVCQAYGREAQVITHGVDLVPAAGQAIESLRVKLGLQGRRVLLTVNYLHPRKRIDLLIRAMPYILQEVPQAVAVVVGSGPELDRLIKLRDEMNLRDKVVFAGFVNEEMLPAYYALSDVYVHTAKQESFGLSIIEAMAAGKPVVAVNEGGPRETVVDGETGFLIPAEPESLACCISDVLRDASLANTFGINGRWRVEKCYNWSIGAQTFIHVCYECIGQTKSRGGNR